MSDYKMEPEIAAFLRLRAQLSETAGDPWVVFAEGQFQGRFAGFEQAYAFAAAKFRAGTFLIRELNVEAPFAPLICVAA